MNKDIFVERILRPSREWSRMADPRRNRSRSRSNDCHQQDNDDYTYDRYRNRYSNLNRNVDEHEVINSVSNNTKKVTNPKNDNDNNKSSETKQRIPPIKVTNKKISDIRSAIMKISGIKIVQNMFHPTQFGNYIYAQTVADYTVIRKYCDDNGFKYVTHPLNDEIIERFCLYGLEKMSQELLLEELGKKEVRPDRITEIPIKHRRYDDHCIYVLHFMRKQKVQLKDLQQITGLFNTRVRFAPYDDPNKFEPKQCKRCQGYNHGERGCTQDYKCRRCAGPHRTNDCKHLPEIDFEEEMSDGSTKKETLRDFTAKIDEKFIKCANCGGKHTANYRGCTKRQEMIQLRDAMRKKRVDHQQAVPRFFDANEFGPLPKTGRPIGNNSWQNHSSHSPNYRFQQKHAHQQPPHYDDYQYNDNQNHRDDDLFNAEECKHIMSRFMSKLSTCRSKQDQISIIGELTFEFLWKKP